MQGFRCIGKTAAYRILLDEDGFGLEIHAYSTPGLPTPYIQATTPTLKWKQFYWRSDWPKWTLVFCTDVGVNGSHWRWNGAQWVIDRPFVLFSLQSIIGPGVASMPIAISNTLTGFRSFANRGGQLPQSFFANPGRRLHVDARVIRGVGTTNAPSTQLVLGTTALMTWPWDIAGDMREQRIDEIITTADATSIAINPGNQVTNKVNSNGLLPPGGSVITTAASADSAVITNLERQSQTLYLGINDTGSNGATYGLLDLAITCQQ